MYVCMYVCNVCMYVCYCIVLYSIVLYCMVWYGMVCMYVYIYMYTYTFQELRSLIHSPHWMTELLRELGIDSFLGPGLDFLCLYVQDTDRYSFVAHKTGKSFQNRSRFCSTSIEPIWQV